MQVSSTLGSVGIVFQVPDSMVVIADRRKEGWSEENVPQPKAVFGNRGIFVGFLLWGDKVKDIRTPYIHT